jgi:hypothetical protein
MVRETSLDDATSSEEGDRVSLGDANWAITAEERERRHGHKPGIFLLGNRGSLVKLLERALFDDGFHTVALDASGVTSPALKRLLASLYGAGLVVLCTNASLEPGGLVDLPSEATLILGDAEDFVAAPGEVDEAQIAQRALSFAKKLRLSSDSKPARREP